MRSSVKMKTSGRKKSGATFFGRTFFLLLWDLDEIEREQISFLLSSSSVGHITALYHYFFFVIVVSKIQRNTATNFQRKTGNIWCSNIATAGELQKTSTCVICGSNFNPRLLLCKIVEKDALLSLWLPYWLYRQARQVSSSTLLVKVEREKWISQQQ